MYNTFYIQLSFIIIWFVYYFYKKITNIQIDKKAFKIISEEEFIKNGAGKIIDVNEENSFEFDHISGAKNIPYLQKIRMNPNLDGINLRKDLPKYIYANTEKNAIKAARLLYKKGYENFYILKGGLISYSGETTGTMKKKFNIGFRDIHK